MANKKEEIIKLENVKKSYKMGKVVVNAVNGVSLTIYKGEFVGIEGPSGSGKSTLLNIVGCLDVPTSGEVYLDSKNISVLSESDLASIRGKKIGFIFQQFNLIPTLTAVENIMLPMIFQGTSKERRLKKAKELLKLVDLSDRMFHKPNELSGGQQQRVAIARALANDPQVILADEPTGNLDSTTGQHVMQMLEKLNDEGITIVMVTHDPRSATHAKRVIFIKDGKLCTEKDLLC